MRNRLDGWIVLFKPVRAYDTKPRYDYCALFGVTFPQKDCGYGVRLDTIRFTNWMGLFVLPDENEIRYRIRRYHLVKYLVTQIAVTAIAFPKEHLCKADIAYLPTSMRPIEKR